MKRPHGYGDRYMLDLWRQAVLRRWNYTDPISGHVDPSGESLQCHHIVGRRHWLLRYDARNGIPLTVESHQYAHTGEGRERVRSLVDSRYLDMRERLRKHDYMTTHCLSEREVLEQIKNDLLLIIKEGADDQI
jgi:hypothetical protein